MNSFEPFSEITGFNIPKFKAIVCNVDDKTVAQDLALSCYIDFGEIMQVIVCSYLEAGMLYIINGPTDLNFTCNSDNYKIYLYG